MAEDQRIEFFASLPTNSNAISLKGDGSARVVLDLSGSELAKLLPLAVMGDKLLKVTIDPE